MPNNWEKVHFGNIFSTISSRSYQIQQNEIQEIGDIPVISQSQNYIEGYSNQQDKLLEITYPVIIFGDHTRIVKYIDFSFIVGADGVKIIKPLIDTKYTYYYMQYVSTKIENKGYSRHFQFVKKELFNVPPIQEQRRITSAIEAAFEKLDAITAEL